MITSTDYKVKATVLSFISASDNLAIAKARKTQARIEAGVLCAVNALVAIALVATIASPISGFNFGNAGKTFCIVAIAMLLGAFTTIVVKSVADAREAGEAVSEAQNAYNENYLEAWKAVA